MGGFGLCGFQFINLSFLIGIGIQQNPFFLTISRLEERSRKIRCVRDNPGLGRLIHRQGYLHTIFIAGKECFKVLCLFKDVQAILNNPHMVFGFCYGVGPRHGFNSPFGVQIGMNLNGVFCFGFLFRKSRNRKNPIMTSIMMNTGRSSGASVKNMIV